MTGASNWILAGLLIVAGASCGSGMPLTGTGTGGDPTGGRGTAGESGSGGAVRGAGGGSPTPGGRWPTDAAVVDAGPSCESMMCDSSSFCATATFNGATRLNNCLPRGGCNDCGCMFAIVEAYLEANTSSWVVPRDCHCSPADAGGPISISCNEV